MGEFKIQRISDSQMEDLKNIKKHTGISIANFIKHKIPSHIESYYQEFPHHRMKKDPE
jgi:hypothetical protein